MARCPVCQAQFRGALPTVNANYRNGLDRDFCQHSQGETAIHSLVWMCPDCGYSALLESFETTYDKQPLSDALRTFVTTTISPQAKETIGKLSGLRKGRKIGDFDVTPEAARNSHDYVEQEHIPDWLKYANAIKIYREEKAPASMMARLYLEAAYACRRNVTGEISIPSLYNAMEESLSLSIRRMQVDLTLACLEVRRGRNLKDMFDPLRPETDATVLVEGARNLLKAGEQTGERIRTNRDHARNGQPNAKTSEFLFVLYGDMFVMWTRYAGFLDRVGRMDDCAGAFDEAAKYIPREGEFEVPDNNPKLIEFFNTRVAVDAHVHRRAQSSAWPWNANSCTAPCGRTSRRFTASRSSSWTKPTCSRRRM